MEPCFFSIRNTSHGQKTPACRLFIFLPLWTLLGHFLLEIKRHNMKFSLQPTQENRRQKTGPAAAVPKKPITNSLDNSQNKQRNSSDYYRITNYKYFLTAAHHIHGFLRPAWAHLFSHIIYKSLYKVVSRTFGERPVSQRTNDQ